MWILRLTGMLYSRKKIKELVLAVEVFLMVIILTISFVPIGNSLVFENRMSKMFSNTDDLIYFSPVDMSKVPWYTDGTKALTPNDIEFSEGIKAEVYETSSTYVETSGGNKINLIKYTDNLYKRLDFSLSAGSQNQTRDGAVSVIISPALVNIFNIGETYSLYIGEEKEEILFFISGVLSKRSNIINITSHVASPELIDLSRFGRSIADMENKGACYMLVVGNGNLLEFEDSDRSCIFSVPKGTDTKELTEELNEKYNATANFSYYDAMYNVMMKETLKNNSFNILLLMLFAIVFVFNYLGYILINIKQKQHLNAIMNICGLSFFRLVMINMLSMIFVTLPPVIIGLVAAPHIIAALEINFYGYNFMIYAAIVLFFAITLVISVLVAFIRRKNAAIIKSYKEV
ncbi:MAG: hypothetical protein ACI4QR_00500 [Eubacteriales bacterium]